MMLDCAADIAHTVDQVQADLPAIQADYQEKVSTRLREALQAASPDGFASISGQELSARISQESTLFSLRIDVAEAAARLRSHLNELRHILQDTEPTPASGGGKNGDAAKTNGVGAHHKPHHNSTQK